MPRAQLRSIHYTTILPRIAHYTACSGGLSCRSAGQTSITAVVNTSSPTCSPQSSPTAGTFLCTLLVESVHANCPPLIHSEEKSIAIFFSTHFRRFQHEMDRNRKEFGEPFAYICANFKVSQYCSYCLRPPESKNKKLALCGACEFAR